MKSSHDTAEYTEFGDTIAYWTRFLRGMSGTILRWIIVSFIVYWMYTAWVMCGDISMDKHSRAIAQRDEWCTRDRVTKEERTRRLAQHDCIEAHHAIQEGPFRLTVECFVGKHLEYFGRCSEFQICRSLIDWAETLRGLTWFIAVLAVLVAAKALYESIISNSTTFKEAMASTARYSSQPLPTTRSHVKIPTEVLITPAILKEHESRRRDVYDYNEHEHDA